MRPPFPSLFGPLSARKGTDRAMIQYCLILMLELFSKRTPSAVLLPEIWQTPAVGCNSCLASPSTEQQIPERGEELGISFSSGISTNPEIVILSMAPIALYYRSSWV